MYPLSPARIYVLERVYQDSRWVKRLERILRSLNNAPDPVIITGKNLPEVLEELKTLWPPATVPPELPKSFTRPLVFTTMELHLPRPNLKNLLDKCPKGTSLGELENIYGHMSTAIDQHPHSRDQENNCVCWPTYNFGTIVGCSHGCLYCGEGREGKFLSVALNLEEIMEKVVRPVIEANPWNRVFRMILQGADLITFEPEYGLFDLFSQTLASYPERYGHFHTSSANVDWLAELKHKERLVGVWSVSCEKVAQEIELGTGKATDRFDAARKCQEIGIPVRFKFKPVIPVKDWQKEYAAVIDYALKNTQPESIGFCLYIWNTFESMSRTLPLDLLDPECVQAAREAQEEMKGKRCGPFPHETRKNIYRFLIQEVRRRNKEILLYLSTETREMWDELKDELGQDPRFYICGCSSVAVPGKKLALNPGLRYSTYNVTPV
ncbi:MAG: radical SAM protein [Candidatus Omnitrophica bacterium]|nr:radical SAM protein [Candidatus Omnitrophota bacterium]